ncbi:Uncharacterized protein C11orf74, partial [Buceros rhinoceros silvestris]
LLAEEEGKTTEGGKVDSLSKTFSASELSNRSKEDGLPGRSEEMGVSPPPYTPKESEPGMCESWGAGGFAGSDLSLPTRAEVDKHLDLEDVDTDEKMCSESLVLPGEVDQTVAYCPPLLDKPVQRKFRPLSVPQPLCSRAQELLGDDVQPFSLDEEFDYDSVALTPKFSEAELKAIVGLSEEKKMG